jgi:hypothetical protein
MARFDRISTTSFVAIFGYVALPFLLIGGGNKAAAELALWTASPLAVPLMILFFARQRHTRVATAILLACLWLSGAALLLWGLVLNRTSTSHLVVIFLPLYQFGFLAVGFVLLWLTSAVVLLLPFLSRWITNSSR